VDAERRRPPLPALPGGVAEVTAEMVAAAAAGIVGALLGWVVLFLAGERQQRQRPLRFHYHCETHDMRFSAVDRLHLDAAVGRHFLTAHTEENPHE
jgi:membrane protein DedA with SNARE-associated domain